MRPNLVAAAVSNILDCHHPPPVQCMLDIQYQTHFLHLLYYDRRAPAESRQPLPVHSIWQKKHAIPPRCYKVKQLKRKLL